MLRITIRIVVSDIANEPDKDVTPRKTIASLSKAKTEYYE